MSQPSAGPTGGGSGLDPQVEELLAGQRSRPALADGSPREARAGQVAMRPALGTGPGIVEAKDAAIPVRWGTVRTRIFRPPVRAAGVLVYLHGGGWMIGEADDFDHLARQLAFETGYVVLLPEYRLAPEHRFPAGLEDVFDVIAWADAHRDGLAGGPVPLAVAGDSAGANLAVAAACMPGRPAKIDRLAAIYPVADCDFDRGSYRKFAEGYPLTRRDMIWFFDNYCRESERARPEIALLRSSRLADLPETLVVTAEFDVLLDEGVELARRLREAGVAVEHVNAPGLTHGFIRWQNIVDAARRQVSLVARFISRG